MSNKTRFVRTKDGATIAAARPSVGGTVEAYGAYNSLEASGGDYPGFFELELSIPFSEPCTLLCKARTEIATPFSNNGAMLYFKPFNEYSPGPSASPVATVHADIFTTKWNTITGVISLHPDTHSSPYILRAEVGAVNFLGGSAGFEYVSMKLVAVKGNHTGETSVVA